MKIRVLLKPVLGGFVRVAHFSTAIEQAHLNRISTYISLVNFLLPKHRQLDKTFCPPAFRATVLGPFVRLSVRPSVHPCGCKYQSYIVRCTPESMV